MKLIPAALCLTVVTLVTTACNGLFEDIYDDPDDIPVPVAAGQTYVDASDWGKWYYLDLPAVARTTLADPEYDSSAAWVSADIPVERQDNPADPECGIYTYWYDVFGQGMSVNELRDFYPTASQPAPDSWTIAVHRNNVRTNGAEVAATGLSSIDDLPTSREYLGSLTYTPDTWSQSDVWVVQDRMLLGIIGNQGIAVSQPLSSWLKVEMPPMPPLFSMDSQVFVLRLKDGTYGAVQLVNYLSATGVRCCLTIKYKYPL